MPAPAFGTSGAWNSATATSIAFAVPASVAAGDIIVVPMFVNDGATISSFPTGFAHAPGSPQTVNSGNPGAHSVVVAWKRATGADTGTYTFGISSSQYIEGQALRYTGCIASGSPWDSAQAGGDSGNTGVSSTPAVSITTTGANELLIFAGTNWSGGTWTGPTGFTQRVNNSVTLVSAEKTQATAGSTGTVQATCSATDKSGSWLGALLPPTSGVPQWETQPGAHPRWLPRPRRGRLIEPRWPQGQQGLNYPQWMNQPGPHPKWLPKLRRGKQFEPPWPQGQQGQAWPSRTTQPGSHPRWLPRPRRGRFAEPPWAPPTFPIIPQITQQPGSKPKWLPKLRRGRFAEPAWSQGPQTQAYPSVTTQAGPHPRWFPTPRRGRFMAPPPVAPPIPPAIPAIIRQSGARPRFLPELRRGRFTGWPQVVVPLPEIVQAGFRPRWLPKLRRGRFIEPVWFVPQPLTPMMVSNRRHRTALRARRHFFEPPMPQTGQGQPYPSVTTQPGNRPRWFPVPRRGRFMSPPWPAVVKAYPPVLVRGVKPRVPLTIRRGRFTFVPNVLGVVPNVVGRRPGVQWRRRGLFTWVPTPPVWVPTMVTRHGVRVGMRSRVRVFSPPWVQGPQLLWTPTVVETRRSVTTRPVRRAHRFEPRWPQGLPLPRDTVFTLSRIVPKWGIGQLEPSRWTFSQAEPKWEVGGLEATIISAQSLEYIRVGLVTAQVNGVSINPTIDAVQMAFMSSAATPGVSDWNAASWNVVGTNQYQIQCLIGPGGAIQLTAGNYYVWVKIVDNPEIIVRSVDIIQVTS